MIPLPETETSFWESSTVSTSYPKLNQGLSVDVAIVGGGIAGLSAAYFLKTAGLTVAVIERGTLGHGVTNNTTGKVTSQHGLIYNNLLKQHGEHKAKIYGEANQSAIDQINKIIAKEKIDCNWQRQDNYVYTSQGSQIKTFKQEAETAQMLGLPATFETQTTLPFEVTAAVRFANQATFNVKRYLLGLAKIIDGDGSYVFEHTRARQTGVNDGIPCTVKTGGGTITAQSVIVATNVPFTAGARGSYCVMEYPQKSYIVAGKVDKKFEGMYISPDSGHYSILPFIMGKEQLLLIGGEGHIPGFKLNPETRYQRLAKYAKSNFGMDNIKYRWAARDYMAYDSVPLIGKLYPWSKNVYVTTAYMKWGLTGTTVSAMILRDLIIGKENGWTKTFDSSRSKPIKSIPKVFASYIGLK